LQIINYYFRYPEIGAVATEFMLYARIVIAAALGLGVINLTRFQVLSFRRRATGRWFLAPWVLIMMGAMSYYGIAFGLGSSGAMWLINSVYSPIYVTVYGMLGFWVIAAAFRTCRARNVEALILLVCAIIALMRVVPIGDAIWPGFTIIGDFLNEFPAAGFSRVIDTGVAIGALAFGVRLILGIEKGYLGIE
jgi:hypothetical protein